MRVNPLMCLAAVVAFTSLTACDKSKSKSDESEADKTVGAGEVGLTTNPLGESYPVGLSVSALSTVDDETVAANYSVGTVAIDYSEASLRLALAGTPAGGKPNGGGPGQCVNSYEEKLAQANATQPKRPATPPPPGAGNAAAQARINGTAASCLSDTFIATLQTMTEAIQESAQPLDGYGDCFVPDWGIVNGFDPESDDVCTVGYARGQLAKLSSYVDFTKGLSEAMLCQALKDGVIKSADKELAEGAELDLTASLTKALASAGNEAPPVTSAKVKRLAGGRRFLTEFVVKPHFDVAGQGQDVAINFAIDHQPVDATNAAYSGVVRVHLAAHRKTNINGSETDIDGVSALSLDYARGTDTVGKRVKYELRSGFFARTEAPYDANGVVDFNVFDKNADNDKLNMMNYVSYDGYPELDVAKLSYWVNFGGRYTETARGMVFDIQRVDGKVKGCAVAGATSLDSDGLSIRRSLAEGYALQPVGYLRPFLCSDSTGPKMWLQCFVRNEAGAYVPDPDLITDTKNGFDFVAASVIEAKVPSLADVPRPPKYTSAQYQPPPGAPVRPAETRPKDGTPTQPAPGAGG